MYFWNTYPFVRLSTALIIGITLFDSFPNLWQESAICLAFLAGITSISVLLSHKLGFYRLRHLNGILALLAVCLIGGFLTKTQHHSLPVNHYKFKLSDSRIKGFYGTINSVTVERTNHYRYDLNLFGLLRDSVQATSGTIHLYIRKDSIKFPKPSFGDSIIVTGQIYPIRKADNPKEFDYREFLNRQHIYAQSFIAHHQMVIKGNHSSNPLMEFAYNLREKAAEIINKNIPEKRERAIANALLLGIKDYLDNEIKKAYSSAGAMHVLAVSGLHVGILYLFLTFLFRPFSNRGFWSNVLTTTIHILVIWIYAMITGLSPSVLRAATMFSLITLGNTISREHNIYNTLGITAFMLLVIDPYFIYSIGFQLSFTAVFGILYLQPKLYQLLSFDYWLLDKAWSITCVSISAQFATFPLSTFYFHQFPSYFLLSNLVIIPGAFLMLVLGITMLLVDPALPIIGAFLGRALYYPIWTINEGISMIEKLPFSLIDWIYLDLIGLILVYTFIITLLGGLHFRSFKTITISIATCLAFAFWNAFAHYQQSKEHKLIFYTIDNRTVIDHIDGSYSKLLAEYTGNFDLTLLGRTINPSRLAARLTPIQANIEDLDKYFPSTGSFRQGIIGGKKILLIDTTTFHLDFHQLIETDVLIINNGAVKNLGWLSKHFRFQHLLVGNKNTRLYSRKLKYQAQEEGIDLHSLKEDGAFVLPIKHKKRADSLPALFTTNPD